MATFEIEINGWGGEVVLGKISQEAYEFWSVRDDDDEELNNHLFWDAYGDDEPNPITDPEDPRFLGNWHEIDSIEHCSGANVGMMHIKVTDEDGNTVWESEDTDECQNHVDTFNVSDLDPGFYLKAWQSEKGNFFIGTIETTVFDHRRIKFFISDIEDDPILSGVEYNDIDIDNEGYDTRGKGSGFEFYEIL